MCECKHEEINSEEFIGILYRIDDLDSGKFYIGITTDLYNWKSGYMGSGKRWLNHLNKYPSKEYEPENESAHYYERTVLRSDFSSKEELFEEEIREIIKYCKEKDGVYKVDKTTGCMNIKTAKQGECNPCDECGGVCGHKKSCSKRIDPKPCEECGKIYGHKKKCPKYKKKACSECGARGRHYSFCSKAKEKIICPDCKGIDGKHKKGCSKRKTKPECSKCGGIEGHHRKGCPNRVVKPPCPDCGGIEGHHKSSCKKKKRIKPPCDECGAIRGHYSTCSKFKKSKPCSKCGGLRGKHDKNCPDYKPNKPCPECKSGSTHKPWCSKSKSKE